MSRVASCLVIFGYILLYSLAKSSLQEDVGVSIEGEKNCADYGNSVGRLYWGVFMKDGQLTAQCQLREPTSGLNYAMYWTSAKEYESERVVQECKGQHLDVQTNGTLSCTYSQGAITEDGHITCFVKTYKGSNSRTRCSSEDILLDGRLPVGPKTMIERSLSSSSAESSSESFAVKHLSATRTQASRAKSVLTDGVALQLDAPTQMETTLLPMKSSTPSASVVATRRPRPQLREIPPESSTTTAAEEYDTTEPSNAMTDVAEDGLEIVSATVDVFAAASHPNIESETVTPPPPPPPVVKEVARQRYVPLAGPPPSTPPPSTLPPQPDTFHVEGWHLRLVLVASAVAALLVAGSAIGTTLALKYHNRSRECCEAECCRPCGGRMN